MTHIQIIQICVQYKQRSFQCAKCVEITPIPLKKIKASKQRMTSIPTKQEECENDDKQRLESVFNERLDNIERKLEKLVAKEDVNKESKRLTCADAYFFP